MSETSPVTVTPEAAGRLLVLLKDSDEKYIRAYVQGGGCSGFQYGLISAKEATSADTICESNGITVLIDPISLRYLSGAVIDWKENLVGGGFFFNNPHAKGTCGCGSSFEPNE
jgi:iron-sulfur cluster insertion protein